MRSSIDGAGRVVIPAEIRKRAGLAPGTRLDVRYNNGVVEIEPAPLRVKLVDRGSLVIAVPLEPVPPLTDAEVRETLERIRDERSAE